MASRIYSCIVFRCASRGTAGSAENLRDRGFDFEFATLVFEGSTLEREDDRRDYGEKRVVAIGLAQGIALTVVFTIGPKPASSSVDSFRPA